MKVLWELPAPSSADLEPQDNDDIACFEVVGGAAVRVVLIHGWTSEGYVVCETYENCWEWIKGVIDDIAQKLEP